MKLKKFVAAAVSAVLSLTMLTACGGGGGGGGTPIKATTYSATKTYAMSQASKDTSGYLEYWIDGIGNMGDDGDNDLKPEEIVWKQGTANGKAYIEKYERNKHVSTDVINDGQVYQVFHYTTDENSAYHAIVVVSGLAGVKTPAQDVYLVSGSVGDELAGVSASQGVAIGGSTAVDTGDMSDSSVNAAIGTYKGYYAEIFTPVKNPNQVSITYAYDRDDTLKLIVIAAPGYTETIHVLKAEANSSSFSSAKLDLAYYNAVDRTAAYIAGLKILIAAGSSRG